MVEIKQKACAACQFPFTPWKTTQRACSPPCAIEWVRMKALKKAEAEVRRETVVRKKAIKTLSQWHETTQKAFNWMIRERDHGNGCISCGQQTGCQFHAGHFRSRKSAPEIRYSERNCFLQCSQCNNRKSGNRGAYRRAILRRFGADELMWLEGPHAPAKYTIDQLEAMAKDYRARARIIKQARGDG